MIHKLCQNHLTELYEAIRREDIAQIKTVEHELSQEEECVACTYALRAEGQAKDVLLQYLKKDGFSLEVSAKRSIFEHFWFWGARAAVSLGVFAAVLVVTRLYFALFISFIAAFALGAVALLIIDRILE